jgi:outer membrane murein-binding lipoprotein Lpp
MFGKSDLVDSLSRDLAQARNKRDALASTVTALSAQIAELETRLSAENDRRERERAASEVEAIKKRVRDAHLAFVPAIATIRNATEVAETIVPAARELNDLLDVIASEVAKSIDGFLGNLDRRIEALRSPEPPQALNRSPELRLVHAAPEQSLNVSPEVLQNSDGIPCPPEWLGNSTKKESIGDRCCTTAA